MTLTLALEKVLLLLVLGMVLVSECVSAQGSVGTTQVTLANELLSLSFDTETSSLCSFLDVASGQDMVARTTTGTTTAGAGAGTTTAGTTGTGPAGAGTTTAGTTTAGTTGTGPAGTTTAGAGTTGTGPAGTTGTTTAGTTGTGPAGTAGTAGTAGAGTTGTAGTGPAGAGTAGTGSGPWTQVPLWVRLIPIVHVHVFHKYHCDNSNSS